jgi:hypothetical protein
MAYTILNPEAGICQIANTDAGVTFANASSAAPTPPNQLGKIVRAIDPTYGEGEFIMLAGVASTAIGSLVVYDGTTYATTLIANSANQSRPVAVAMSANTSSSTYGWYQIGGTAVVKKTTVAIAPKVSVGIGGVGVLGNTASGKEILGARSANTATVASATTTINVVINRPHAQGRVT